MCLAHKTRWLCCTQAALIFVCLAHKHEIVHKRGLERLPIPWGITREFIASWNQGEETRLYKRLGIYR